MEFETARVDRRDLLKVFAGTGGGLAIGGAVGYLSRTPERVVERIPTGAAAKPWVLVTPLGPDDGGDFGPNTPGTKTSGIQEALDFARESERDVYIVGGRGGLHGGVACARNVYHLHETLRVPWSQDFRLDGGNYLLNYTKDTGDVVTIDSQMNCRYKFGLIVGTTDGASVRIRPETPGPDDSVVITASVFDFSAIVNFHPDGTGMRVDSSKGPIIHNRIFAEEINAANIGLHLVAGASSGESFSNNWVQVMYGNLHHSPGRCTGLRVGDPGLGGICYNRIDMSITPPSGVYFDPQTKKWITPESFEVPEDAIGVDIFGQNNLFYLTFYGSRRPGKDIIFEPEAKDNTLFAFSLPSGVTNRAITPTNRIIPCGAVGFKATTPSFPPSGEYVVNTTPYIVEVLILSPGKVLNWTITEAKGGSQTISAGLTAGQTFVLEPGDKVKFNYSEAPTWRWKALR